MLKLNLNWFKYKVSFDFIYKDLEKTPLTKKKALMRLFSKAIEIVNMKCLKIKTTHAQKSNTQLFLLLPNKQDDINPHNCPANKTHHRKTQANQTKK